MIVKLIKVEENFLFDDVNDDKNGWTLTFETKFLKRKITRRIRLSSRAKIGERIGRYYKITGLKIFLLKEE